MVPFKGLHGAKSRLAAVLAPAARRRLALTMLEHVAHTIRTAGMPVMVVGRTVPVAGRLAAIGATGYATPLPLNAALLQALDAAWRAGYTHALVLPADLPRLEASEVRRLAASLVGVTRGSAGKWASGRVVLVGSPDGGTNALGLPLPAPLQPEFGPGSLARHAGAARDRGLRVVQLALPGVEFDVDRPEDLARLGKQEQGGLTA